MREEDDIIVNFLYFVIGISYIVFWGALAVAVIRFITKFW